MKILIYSPNFSPEPVGIGKYSGEMAHWLVAQGYEVRVVAAPPLLSELECPGRLQVAAVPARAASGDHCMARATVGTEIPWGPDSHRPPAVLRDSIIPSGLMSGFVAAEGRHHGSDCRTTAFPGRPGNDDIRMRGYWWSQSGSNRRPLPCHGSALPAELWPHAEPRKTTHPPRYCQAWQDHPVNENYPRLKDAGCARGPPTLIRPPASCARTLARTCWDRIAMGPAETHQVVEESIRQAALLFVLQNAHRAMPLRQFRAVPAENHRHMRVLRYGRAKSHEAARDDSAVVTDSVAVSLLHIFVPIAA